MAKTKRPSNVETHLTSQWGDLSKYLIADFYMVNKRENGKWGRAAENITVSAPLVEASMEVALNWQSPFEQSGAESKAPMLMAMLQSGVLAPVVGSLLDLVGGSGKKVQENADQAAANSARFLTQFEGKTGITKLNSTQVFTGMPPIKIQVSALFRAWTDTAHEVEAPFDQLMQWALPEYLESRADYATLLGRAASAANGQPLTQVDVLLPSKSPVRVGMTYKNRVFSPLVIESIGFPMQSPVDSKGRYAELLVPMTLCTLTALDRNDWGNTQTPL